MALHGYSAEELDAGIGNLSKTLADKLNKVGAKKVSVVDFTDLQGRTNDLGRFIAEQLSVVLVNSSEGFAVVDRARMKIILDELKLNSTGLVDPEAMRNLGKVSGADTIIMGTFTAFEDSVALTAKAVSTETTDVIGASAATVIRSKNVNTLLSVAAIPQPTNASEVKARTPPSSSVPSDKDFVAPNGMSVFSNIECEVLSFKVHSPGNVIVLVKVKNRNSNNSLRIGLNSNNKGQEGTFLTDDIANVYPLSGTGGLLFTRSYYGGDRNTFEALRRMASEAERALKYNAEGARRILFEDLDKNTDIGPAQSITFTLQFSNRTRTAGKTYRINMELIVAEIQGEERVKVSLNNVVIPNIQPKG